MNINADIAFRNWEMYFDITPKCSLFVSISFHLKIRFLDIVTQSFVI